MILTIAWVLNSKRKRSPQGFVSNFDSIMKILKSFILIFLLSSSIGAYAGKLEKAFESLGKYDYFGAKEIFDKLKEKETVGAPYGLSIIFGRSDNPFYNLDSAHIYVSLAEANLPTADEKKVEQLQALGINEASLAEWKDSIDYLAWTFAKEKHTV